MLTVPPLQIVALLELVMLDAGFTLTLTVCGPPAQPCGLEVAVTVYSTSSTIAVLLTSASLNGLPVCVVVLSPVVLGLLTAIHVYVEALSLVNAMLNVAPLQMVAPGVLVIVGAGFTVTVMLCGAPRHPSGLDVGVTV